MSASQSGPRVEDGVVVGTASNKYHMRNPIARYLVRGFDHAIVDLLKLTSPRSITEVGCGEGHVTHLLRQHTGLPVRATDISNTVMGLAADFLDHDPQVTFVQRAVEQLQPAEDSADLVVCCEVLEHLEDPGLGLDALASIARSQVLLSVPREPLFRGLNLARGAYIGRLGSSPGHLQHWSRGQFLRFVRQHFDIVDVRSPLPWTVLLARVR